jgi:plasmid maintenance system antidote protein VapI
MDNKNQHKVGIEAISHLLQPPSGAYKYIDNFLIKKNVNPTQAAKALEVSPSTVKRLLDGGSLTTTMAAKLFKEYGVDPEILFNLEAQAYSYQAKELARQQVA